ncbi:Flp/Fap pilin component [Pseudovibrio sp. W64]|uniref:Flp family type IVb pilin n=1 Tax=unclassified Pseudovibrio TaxID=2627060 RepID=UPI00070BF68D|nr:MULTISPECIES: Flp family type IVb pilin [unclassified Pseudovibrio]KZK81846.1 Flp/Fap pilin component [Pseudovibrio sp. W64]
MFAKFLKDESGATAIEYGILAAFIAVAIIGAVTILGDDLTAVFDNISTQLEGAKTAAPN